MSHFDGVHFGYDQIAPYGGPITFDYIDSDYGSVLSSVDETPKTKPERIKPETPVQEESLIRRAPIAPAREKFEPAPLAEPAHKFSVDIDTDTLLLVLIFIMVCMLAAQYKIYKKTKKTNKLLKSVLANTHRVS